MARQSRRSIPWSTILFCIGLAGLGYIVFIQEPTTPSSTTSSTASSTVPTNREPQLVLVNESSARVMYSDGSLVASDAYQTPIEGAQAANGSVVRYRNEFRSPDRRRIATLEAPKADSASVLRLTEGDNSSTIVLRLGNASLRDARIHGWSDAGTIFISGVVTSTRIIADVNVSGTVRRLATLPDSTLSVEARGGSLWYITASPGEGIESDPIPPAELHRVSVSHGDELIVREETKLILNAVPGSNNALVYLTSDGQATYFKIGETTRISLGKRHPLLILNGGRVLLRDGFDLFLQNPQSGQIDRIGTLPEGSVDVYPFSP